ncbi:hypothetical protein BABINDRAFT_160962 [Babjeviella inositovora NRRL Y-12698]|uniref:choline-phosphate cytidylyltransferase n=1 Tax=Babjeviella inositovora NRRL Y-12698 TaxID=984486 RepID=A0A1E3QTA5_9ASCO|nr:uncharacterized protein BABINDRAFT_160962 [Babjeviella inositovora NRRL Y-12698]ODQ80744.1 hypothetical protein BABINDRAFT_160962 [Babjeviella inositovora NRRL Y-12698]
MSDDDHSLRKALTRDSAKNLLQRSSSITNLFRKRKRDQTPSEDSLHSPLATPQKRDDSDTLSESTPVQTPKRQKVLTKEQQAFQEQEKAYDAELPEAYRKYRPEGFRFNVPPTDRPVRIYADGVFDLFHLGHMKQLEQSKKAFPNVELVCGVPSDFETHKRKGLTVLKDVERCETLTHCRWVDEVIPDAPWCVTTDFLEKHRIDYVAHDDLPYASADSDDIYKPIKEQGKFLTTQRTEGISTSDIITKIIRDYDKYLLRNFARGATRKDLNVSWLKKNELDLRKHISEFRGYWKKTTTFNKLSRDLYYEVREFLKKGQAASPARPQLGRSQSSVTSRTRSSSTDEDDSSMSFPPESPATEFASRYNANANKKSFIDNVKGWLGGELSEYDTEDDSKSVTPTSNSDDEAVYATPKKQPAEFTTPKKGKTLKKPAELEGIPLSETQKKQKKKA